MKKLTKKEAAELAALTEKLENAILAANEARAEFITFQEDVFSRASEYFDDRTERWQEGEAGEAYQCFRDTWEEEPCDEIPETVTEYPESPE